jgi:hypothetical protein
MVVHMVWQLAAAFRMGGGRCADSGSQVVKRLIASELCGKGDMKFSSKGLLCTIEIPSGQALLKNE